MFEAKGARSMSSAKQTVATMGKYVGVSGAQTILELALFTVLHLFADRQVANVVAIVFSATFQFVMNRKVTFKSSSNVVRSGILFVALWLFNLAFSSAMLAFVPEALGWPAEAVKLLCMACQGVWGWLLSRHVIFR